MVTFFVTVMGPYPAASSATISPPSLTTVWADAKVRHGFARPQPEPALPSDPADLTKARWTDGGAAATDKLSVTCGAALGFASPAWSALTVQVPVLTIVRFEPDTVHTAGVEEVKATV